AARQQRRKVVKLGLLRPPPNASQAEVDAYNGIALENEPNVTWILKQNIRKEDDKGERRDLITTAASPYVTATRMLNHVRSLGNKTTQQHAAAFLSAWRSCGSPFPISSQLGALLVGEAGTVQATQAVSHAPRSAVDETFTATHYLVEHYKCRVAAVHIKYR
ncbi:hypothetical protein PMIN07_010669, partial [Paraphaeosphaeria minitans]